MGRTSQPTATALGSAVRDRRAAAGQVETAEAIGITQTTLSRIERGTNLPTYPTAKALAAWLGWTVDEVMQAAETPAET